MTRLSSGQFLRNLDRLIHFAVKSDERIMVDTEAGKVVMISAAHWRGVQGRLYPSLGPGVKDSNLERKREAIEDRSEDPGS